MKTHTSRKQNLMIGRVENVIKTQNMFKFDLKHGYYHINQLVPLLFVENWKSCCLNILLLQFLPAGLD